MNSYAKVQRLFTRVDKGLGPREHGPAVTKFAQGLATGKIALHLCRIPKAAIWAGLTAPLVDSKSEGREHLVLKSIAAEWLGSKARLERHLGDYRIDVLAWSDGGGSAVECGHSHPSKFLQLAEDYPNLRLFLLPFRRRPITAFSTLCAVQIDIASDFAGWMSAKRPEGLQDAVTALNLDLGPRLILTFPKNNS